jgi:hypothetical protein
VVKREKKERSRVRFQPAQRLKNWVRPATFHNANVIYFLTKTSYLNVETNGNEPSPSVNVPWFMVHCVD